MKKGDEGKGSLPAQGGQKKRRKDSDGYAAVKAAPFINSPVEQPQGAASSLRDPPVQAGRPGGLESHLSPQAICYKRGESEEAGVNSRLGFRKHTVFRDS